MYPLSAPKEQKNSEGETSPNSWPEILERVSAEDIMEKNFKIKNNYIILEVESLYDLKVFSETRKYIDEDIQKFWQEYNKGRKIFFPITKEEFIKYYMS